jgi:hypothetical protein
MNNFNPDKPKVSLRRFTDPLHRLSIKTFMLNKGTQSEAKALEMTHQILGSRICIDCRTKEVETDGGEQVSLRCRECNDQMIRGGK